MNTNSISFLLAAPDCALFYQTDQLCASDQNRLKANPALSCRIDWQVSRYLKQQSTLPLLSLSHSKGAALLAASASSAVVGVDLEKIRPRDFAALSAYSCSSIERQWLAERGWTAEDYYRLWTLKEAMVKAAGLNFPAAMPHIGLIQHTDGTLGLQDATGHTWHGISALCQDWALACVWDRCHTYQPIWQFFGSFSGMKVPLRDIWQL